jgi:hypothetical protein
MENAMRMIEKRGNIEIWKVIENYGHGPVAEYYVYGVYNSGDPRVCPSLGMAREVAGF